MFKQEVCSQDLDGVIDKMHALITNQCEWATKSHHDKFVKESCYDHCRVDLQCFGLQPLGSLIGCHHNIVVTCVTSCWFDGAYEMNAPFCERFDREHCDQFN